MYIVINNINNLTRNRYIMDGVKKNCMRPEKVIPATSFRGDYLKRLGREKALA